MMLLNPQTLRSLAATVVWIVKNGRMMRRREGGEESDWSDEEFLSMHEMYGI
jgi:hypothetical protein